MKWVSTVYHLSLFFYNSNKKTRNFLRRDFVRREAHKNHQRVWHTSLTQQYLLVLLQGKAKGGGGATPMLLIPKYASD